MKVITEVLVGSRLHGLHNEDSDYDYRGIHMYPLKEVLSPFKKLKNTSWIEGDVDNTSYELADFCKNATAGNATILEVFFSNEVVKTTPIATEMRANWRKFIDTDRVVMASRGYASNQLNKMQLFDTNLPKDELPHEASLVSELHEAGQDDVATSLLAILRHSRDYVDQAHDISEYDRAVEKEIMERLTMFITVRDHLVLQHGIKLGKGQDNGKE